MPAFFIVTTTVKDADKYREYGERVGATLAPFGGKPVLRGKAMSALAGELSHETAGIIEFPDLEAITNWHSSAEYQALLPLRAEAADMTITTYVVPA